MPSDQEQLDATRLADKQRREDENITGQVVAEMKSSLLFQISWAELLQSGPTSIYTMGACLAASTSDKATLELEQPRNDQYKYITGRTLRSNLIQCADLGRFAFLEAESGMGFVQQAGVSLSNKLPDILSLLLSPEDAQTMLQSQMETIQDGTKICFEKVKKIDKKFDDWLLFACELHAACIATDEAAHESVLSSQICMVAEQARLTESQSGADEIKKTKDLLAKQLDLAGEAFKKASDSFPSGWDILGQQVVGELATCVFTTINQAVPALLDTLNPMKKLKAAGDIVGAFAHPRKDKDNDKDTKEHSPVTSGNLPEVQQRPRAVPPQATDPAYSEVLKVQIYSAALRCIVHGKDDDVDWDKAQGDTTVEGAKASIKFIHDMLKHQSESFQQVATTAEPSQTLLTILSTFTRISTEVSEQLIKSKEPKYVLPEKTSTIVKTWHTDFDAQYTAMNVMIATARTLPGSAAGGIPLMAAVDPAVEKAKIDAKTAQGQAVLEAGKNRLNTTQQMLSTTQSNYKDATALLVEQRNKIGDIQANLAKLTSTNLQMKEIRQVLIGSIKLIISLKQQITDLVRFFNALTAMVQIIVDIHVAPFIKTVTAIATGGGKDINQMIGNFSFSDLQRSIVYHAIITIRSYFGVLSDVGKMWVHLSNRYFQQGIHQLDECSKTIDSTDTDKVGKLKKQVSDLHAWATEASDGVKSVAEEEQQKIQGGLDKRIKVVESTTRQLTPPAKPTLDAITKGTDENKSAGANFVQLKAKQNPLLRFANVEEV